LSTQAHEIVYRRPPLYDKQREAMFDPARISLIEASTKSGKTVSGIIWLYEQAMMGKPGQNFWWVAPVSMQARIAFNRMRQNFLDQDGRPIFTVNATDHTLTNARGAVIAFRSGDHPDCYDDQTDVLTQRGWIPFSELVDSDSIMTRSPAGEAQWQKPTRIVRHFYDGEMVSIQNSRISLRVTPHHRMLVERRRKDGLKELWTRADELKPHDSIPAQASWVGVDDPAITEDQCALLGFYLAEGSALGNASSEEKARALTARMGYRIFFAQTAGVKGGNKGDVRTAFADLLTRMNYHVRERRDGLLIWDKALWAKLIALGNKYTKTIPQKIKDLPPHKLRVLLHWMILGDGTSRTTVGGLDDLTYASASKRLADDVQEIAIKCGLSATIKTKPTVAYPRAGARPSGYPLYIVRIHSPRSHHLSSSKCGRYYGKVGYRGMIYCASVPNTCMLVRREGKPCWSGNTLYGEDVYACVIDEASRFKEESWHAIRSTLTATRGPIRIIGNVKGRKNWFYQLARQAEQGLPNLAYHKLTAWDAVNAGVLTKEEIASAKAMLPEQVFRELYLAEPSDDEGNPFGVQHVRACLAPLSERPAIAWGWDLARKQDWTVGIGLDADGRVCEAFRFQKPWHEQVEIIKKFVGNSPALVDETGVGDPIVEAIKLPVRKGSNGAEVIELSCPRLEGYRFTTASKQMLMEGLALAIHERKIRFPEGPISMELMNFEYEFTRLGIRYGAPPGMHDDCVCALALAWRCFDNRKLAYDQDLSWISGDDK
jgi:hypothetical protein